jgi:hypothetical protein
MPNEPSGQVAAPTQGTARVRFEFAGRAHAEKFTPNVGINLQCCKVNNRMTVMEEKLLEASKIDKASGSNKKTITIFDETACV